MDGGEGPVPEKDAGIEALLDITIAYELIYPQVVNIFSVDDTYWSTGAKKPFASSVNSQLTVVLRRPIRVRLHGYHARCY